MKKQPRAPLRRNLTDIAKLFDKHQFWPLEPSQIIAFGLEMQRDQWTAMIASVEQCEKDGGHHMFTVGFCEAKAAQAVSMLKELETWEA